MQNQNGNNLNLKNPGGQVPPSVSYSAEQVQEAIEHIDRSVADNILRGIRKGEIKDPQILNLKPQLQIVNFSGIPDQEAAIIMQSRVFDFFRLEIPLKNSVENRYTIQGHYEKNNQRKILKKAILQNSEKLGSLTIGEWLQKFDQEYKIEEREDRDILNFMLNNNDAQRLTEPQKAVLKKIIFAYDALIADQLVDIYDLVEARERLKRTRGQARQMSEGDKMRDFYRNEEHHNIGQKNTSLSQKLQPRNTEPIKINISQAMSKYPGVSDQLISSDLIKIGQQTQPMKGSIRNWIKDYYVVVGAGNKDIMRRSSYIYHSQNAKSLNSNEKQKLSFVLKALDDDSIVTVDPVREEIIFNTNESIPATPATPVASTTPVSVVAPSPVSAVNNSLKKEDIYGNRNSEINIDDERKNDVSQGNSQAKINHIQGNRFNLKSDHFENSNKNEAKEESGLFGKKHRKEMFEKGVGSSEESIKFSTPQQLPVEKEEKKEVKKDSFFGRIKSVD